MKVLGLNGRLRLDRIDVRASISTLDRIVGLMGITVAISGSSNPL